MSHTKEEVVNMYLQKQTGHFKVLVLSPYITNSYFIRNRTGFGMVVWEISKRLSQYYCDVYLFSYQTTKNIVIDKVNVLSYEPIKVIKEVNFIKFFSNLNWLFKSKIPINKKIRILRYFLSEGYIRKIIHQLNPDIIHIHGLSLGTLPFINATIASNIPFILTLHGLNFFDSNIPISKYERDFEKKMIETLNSKGITITVISTGIKDKILGHFNIVNPEKIVVIPNGIDYNKFQLSTSKEILREKYGIPEDKKVLINVGSLCPLKNQSFLIDAILQLPEYIREKIICFIIGEGVERKRLESLIKENNLEKNVILTGYLDNEKVGEYYTMSDLTVITSTSEGFGMPFLESFACGVPVLTFKDLDAVKDLYNERCMMLVTERDVETLAKGIIKALNSSWDSSFIKEWAKRFSWDKIIIQYLEVYNNVIQQFNNDKTSMEVKL
jgi:glycosyltransferase involved in cell wall biosynthesis